MNNDIHSVLLQIEQRTNEINTWIAINKLIWLVLLLVGLGLLIQAFRSGNFRMWILVGVAPILWACHESSASYYIQMNGAQVYRLEEKLPEEYKKLAHEHQRVANATTASKAAPVGFILPFLALFFVLCYMLIRYHREQYGIAWAVGLFIILVMLCLYYVWIISSIKR